MSKSEANQRKDAFRGMSVAQLANFSTAVNIHLEHSGQQGILIGVMDLEPTKNAVKVLVDGEIQYWPTDGVKYLNTTKRKWVKA